MAGGGGLAMGARHLAMWRIPHLLICIHWGPTHIGHSAHHTHVRAHTHIRAHIQSLMGHSPKPGATAYTRLDCKPGSMAERNIILLCFEFSQMEYKTSSLQLNQSRQPACGKKAQDLEASVSVTHPLPQFWVNHNPSYLPIFLHCKLGCTLSAIFLPKILIKTQ